MEISLMYKFDPMDFETNESLKKDFTPDNRINLILWILKQAGIS